MKSTISLVILALLIGFAAGSFLNFNKASDDNDTQLAQENHSGKRATTRSSGSESSSARTSRKSKAAAKVDAKVNPMITDKKQAEWANKFAEARKKSLTAKYDSRVKKLIEKLDLTPSQEKALRAFFAKKMEANIAPTEMFDFKNQESINEYYALLKSEGLDGDLSDLLSEDQKVAYEELKEKERKNKAESNALSRLANLQRQLELTDEQKDAIYQLYVEDEDNRVASATPLPTQSFVVGGDNNDRAAMAERFKQERQKEIDNKVNRLASVLNEEQQKAYREKLEQNRGMLNGMIQVNGADGQATGEGIILGVGGGE